MHRPAVRTILFRVLLIPALYVSYTLAIWLLPTRAPAQLSIETPRKATNTHKQYHAGWRVWLAHSCQTCHSIYGLGGHLGPDLTNAAGSEMGAIIQVIVREGRAGMPAFKLSMRELNDLVAYLEVIDASGIYPPKSLHDPVFGVSQ